MTLADDVRQKLSEATPPEGIPLATSLRSGEHIESSVDRLRMKVDALSEIVRRLAEEIDDLRARRD